MLAFYICNLLTKENKINLDDCKRGFLANGRYSVYVPQIDFHFAIHFWLVTVRKRYSSRLESDFKTILTLLNLEQIFFVLLFTPTHFSGALRFKKEATLVSLNLPQFTRRYSSESNGTLLEFLAIK